MDETQFGGPDAQEPVGRKPDGRCLLNRLSPDRQAAVADYAATHTLPETVEWLKNPGWLPEPGDITQAGPGDTPSPPGHPQETAVSRSALARWLPGYCMRQRCAPNRNSVGALIKELRSAKPAWTPGEVHQAAQTFFEALALQRQETRLWALTQRLDLRRAQLELSTTKHEDSQRSKLKLGLELNKKMKMTTLAQPAHPSTAQGRIPRCRLKAAFRAQPERHLLVAARAERRLQAAAGALEEIRRVPKMKKDQKSSCAVPGFV
jgi:hypothetical protein